MSSKLDSIAYKQVPAIERKLQRLEETVLILDSIVTKRFHSGELQEIYDKHIDEIRQEINDARNGIS